jgi:hypothetical protein
MAITPERRRKLVLARNAALVLAVLIAVPALYSGLVEFAKSDAFASMRGSSPAPSPSIGMQIGKAEIRHYRGQQLMARADAGKIEIDKDRRQFELFDVTNGIYNTDKGKIDFAAREAVYNAPLQTLFIHKGARVKSKDFDLQTPEVTFSERNGVIQAPKEIRGKLIDGKVQAVTLRYNTKTGGFVTGPTQWEGKLALKLQDGGPDQTPSRWKMRGEDTEYGGTNNQIFKATDATGTDDEIILKSPKMEWNRKTDVVVGTGGVFYFGPEANITADKATLYRKEKRIILEGHVRMFVKPESEQDKPIKEEPIPEFKLLDVDKVNVKPASAPKTEAEKKAIEDLRSSENARKYPTQVAADYIEYWYAKGSRRANIKGNPQARQELAGGMWRHVWTETAKYDGETDRMTLFTGSTAKARLKNAYGDDGIADEYFIISTKEKDDWFTGKKVHGDFYSTDEPEPDKKSTGGGDTKATTGGGAGTGPTKQPAGQ